MVSTFLPNALISADRNRYHSERMCTNTSSSLRGGRDFHRRASRFPRIHLLGCCQHRRTFRKNHSYTTFAHSNNAATVEVGRGKERATVSPSNPQNLHPKPSKLVVTRISCTIRSLSCTLHQLRCSATHEQEPSANCEPPPCPNAPVHHP
jgi:hypothetical protein